MVLGDYFFGEEGGEFVEDGGEGRGGREYWGGGGRGVCYVRDGGGGVAVFLEKRGEGGAGAGYGGGFKEAVGVSGGVLGGVGFMECGV